MWHAGLREVPNTHRLPVSIPQPPSCSKLQPPPPHSRTPGFSPQLCYSLPVTIQVVTPPLPSLTGWLCPHGRAAEETKAPKVAITTQVPTVPTAQEGTKKGLGDQYKVWGLDS